MSTRRTHQHETQPVELRRDAYSDIENGFLVVIEGPRLGHCVRLKVTPLMIGRSPEAGFSIEHPSVSRLHCSVQPEAHGASVRDLDSKNGTHVNGSRVRGAELRDGDLLLTLGAGNVDALGRRLIG